VTCRSSDQDLLLFAHNALGPISRLRVLWHLRGCPDCQARVGKFRSVSQQIAGALRPSGLPAWKPAGMAGGIGLSLTKPAILLVATLMVLLLTATLIVGARARMHVGAPVRTGGSVGPCRPDLPNSRCR
jgi:hypothetical protein